MSPLAASSLSRTIASLRSKWLAGRFRPYLLGGIVVLIITQIVALSPSSVEDVSGSSDPIDQDALLPLAQTTLATGIPTNRVPEYTVEKFNYVSTQGSQKQWSILASRAHMYSQDHLVHARSIHAFLYDPDGKVTLVTGKEAKYFMNGRDLEIFGDVHTLFPDGFELTSQYMKYLPSKRLIEIPAPDKVQGHGNNDDGQELAFESQGLKYAMDRGEVNLFGQVKVVADKKTPDGSKTVIRSDYATIDRNQKIAHFTMKPDRPLQDRFVTLDQPTLFARGRKSEMHYGDLDRLVHYMTMQDDVYLEEKPDPKAKKKSAQKADDLRRATAGQADFDSARDLIILREMPQVYQGSDTVTGEVIVLHRDTDVVEIEHSNAYSHGK